MATAVQTPNARSAEVEIRMCSLHFPKRPKRFGIIFMRTATHFLKQ
jgi:hypothetical protein